MSSIVPGLGYPGGRSGYAAQMPNHAFRGSYGKGNALDNTFGGGVAGQPTPGMYNNLGYAGGRTGYAAQMGNHAFRGTGLAGLGKAASENTVLMVGGLVMASVFISHWSTRKKITGLGIVDDVISSASKIVSPVTDVVKDTAKAIPVVGDGVKGLEKIAKKTF